LPASLPEKPRQLWRKKLSSQGLAGIAADERHVIVVDRDLGDSFDIYRCLDANTGAELWSVRTLAKGKLDYGNSPRATPLIHGEHVYLLGAFGHLQCVELKTGKVVWKLDIRTEFNADDELVWGVAASPLIVDDKLIVNPGAKEASLVALEPLTGKVLWKTPGESAAFSSFILATFNGKRQLVGYDKVSLGGWDIATGTRLWTLVPPRKNDYNVPTPIQTGEHLLVSTENNGTRLYRFDQAGKIVPEPVAVNLDLMPDAHSPILVGNRLFGVWHQLHCLDVKQGLKTLWSQEDDDFEHHTSMIATPERVLLFTQGGELILFDATADKFKQISRVKVLEDETGVYSHPALVGKRLYLRGSGEVICLDLGVTTK
jgi:outer membrane protein assembly factor BamB